MRLGNFRVHARSNAADLHGRTRNGDHLMPFPGQAQAAVPTVPLFRTISGESHVEGEETHGTVSVVQ